MVIRSSIDEALKEAFDRFPPKTGQVLVVGCSTSEILGKRIGTASNLGVAGEVLQALLDAAATWSVELAIQCCEHLNRALVVSRQLAERERLVVVNAIPGIRAGGALAAAAFAHMESPTLVESIAADFGIDIGSTLIGMHLKRVAVPVRVKSRWVGEAHLVVARTRPPYIGGPRTEYAEDKGK